MPQLLINNWSTTLTGALAADGLTAAVASAAGNLLGTITGGDFYKATIEDQAAPLTTKREVVTITARSGGNLTITRASEPCLVGTTLFNTGQAFDAGAIISCRITAGLIEDLQAGAGPGAAAGIGAGQQTPVIDETQQGNVYIDGSDPLIVMLYPPTDDIVFVLGAPADPTDVYRVIILVPDTGTIQTFDFTGNYLVHGGDSFPLQYGGPPVKFELYWEPILAQWLVGEASYSGVP